MKAAPILGIDALRDLLAGMQGARVFILTDRMTYRYCLPVLREMVPELKGSVVLMSGHGEKDKSLRRLGLLAGRMMKEGADRGSLLLNLGGGVVTDLGGMLASVFKRGIRFIHIPTSLTAMVDAAIGGKTAVNLGSVKNQLGTFRQAEAIILYEGFLLTLPHRHLAAGFAEMLKHGLIADEAHWNALLEAGPGALPHSPGLIMDSIRIKQDIVSRDPYEGGERATLNFGHTVGHALEAFFQQRKPPGITHGHAVALGMLAAIQISLSRGMLDASIAKDTAAALLRHFRVPDFREQDIPQVIGLMQADKKSTGGMPRFVLLERPGKAIHGIAVTETEVREAITKSLIRP